MKISQKVEHAHASSERFCMCIYICSKEFPEVQLRYADAWEVPCVMEGAKQKFSEFLQTQLAKPSNSLLSRNKVELIRKYLLGGK